LAPLGALAVSAVSFIGATARAQELAPDEAGEGIDDPKLARRLGTRVGAPSPDEAASLAAGAAPVASTAAAGGFAAPSPEGEVEAAQGPSTKVPLTPRLKVGYRRFLFNQVATPGMSGPAAAEPFDVLSVDFYPISSTWRFGLTSQYGWQEGTFRQNGDAFFTAVTSLGWQIPGPAITPFFEGYAGGGLMQRTKADLGLNSIATAFGELGADLGFEAFLARHFCLSFAAGYVHLTNGYARRTFDSFSVDTWSFKVGFGF
jgi:hypothetical protein